MPHEFLSASSFLAGVLVAMIVSCKATVRAAQSAQEIAKHGVAAQGRVLRIWRPPVLGSFVRVYFEFQPDGHERFLRCCHVDRRPGGGLTASLPAVGSNVSIRYLPENPARAVIARLVARFKAD
jgi:hypothetical protein